MKNKPILIEGDRVMRVDYPNSKVLIVDEVSLIKTKYVLGGEYWRLYAHDEIQQETMYSEQSADIRNYKLVISSEAESYMKVFDSFIKELIR